MEDFHESVNTLKDLEKAWWAFTCTTLGIDEATQSRYARLRYQPGHTPGWGQEEDVVFLSIQFRNALDNAWPDYIQGRETDEGLINFGMHYSRPFEVQWVVYGPRSFDWIDKLRAALYAQEPSAYLRSKNIYPQVGEVPSPTRMPEIHGDKWWERSILNVPFVDEVTRLYMIPPIDAVGIKIFTEKGEWDVDINTNADN